MIFRARAFAIAAGLVAASQSGAATVSDSIIDLLPGLKGGAVFDSQTYNPDALPKDIDVLELLDGAKRDFVSAVDTLEEELEQRADYGSILALAPQLRVYLPRDQRLLLLHALALSATGSLDDADRILDRVRPDAETDKTALPLLARGMMALRRGDGDRAAALVRSALEREPDNAYAHNLHGMISTRAGALPDALESFGAATRLAPETALFWRNLGVTSEAAGQLDVAYNALQNAVKLQPDDCASLIALAQVLAETGQPAKSEAVTNRCLSANPEDVRAASLLVRLQVDQDRLDDALATIARYGESLPDPAALTAEVTLLFNRPVDAITALDDKELSENAKLRLAIARAMSGDSEVALEEIRALRAHAPNTAGVKLAELALSVAVTGTLPQTAGEVSEGQEAWFAALASTTDGPDAAAEMANLAQDMLPGVRFTGLPASDWSALAAPETRGTMALSMLCLLMQYDQAAFEGFSSVAEQSHQGRYFGAIAAVRSGDPQAAMRLLEPTARSEPGYYSAQVLAGEIQLSQGDSAAALASYRNAIEVVEDGGALLKVGVLADLHGDVDVAENALRRFITLFPNSMIGYNQLSWVFVQREMRLEEAEALARKADSLQPGNASVLDNLGWISFLRSNETDALVLLRQANAVSEGRNPDILYHLAAVEAKAGSPTQSLALLDRFAEIAPQGHAAYVDAKVLRDALVH